MLTFSDFIFVYEDELFNYLRKDKKLKYIINAKNINTDQKFWMYEKTPTVQKAIEEYRSRINSV